MKPGGRSGVYGSMKKKSKDQSDPRRVIAYARVSTDKQADLGTSLEAQRARLEAHAKHFELEIVELVVDTASAGSLDRPGLMHALARIDAGEADGLLVVKLDRLTRSVRDLAELVERYFQNHALLSVAEQIDTRTAGGRMMLNVLTAVAQWEREAISERTKAVLQHMRDNGEYTGGWPPFGYQIHEGKLVEDPVEQGVIHTARELRRMGLSVRKIGERLPLNPNTGRSYSTSAVHRMITEAS